MSTYTTRREARSTKQGGGQLGFTLIELVAVASILAIVSLLTLSAVQSAREAWRKIACGNNLKQIGLAMQSYSAVFNKFPPIDCQTRVPGEPRFFSAHSFSGFARILGHLERMNEFNSTNFTPIPWTAEALLANNTVMQVTVGIFLCPSDAQPGVPGYGRCNYRLSLGPTHRFAPARRFPDSFSGPFTVHEDYGPADFQDGLSNTIGISERLEGDWTSGSFKQHGDYLLVADVQQESVLNCDQAISICAAIVGQGPHESRSGETWFLSGFHFTNYNHCLAPNSRVRDCGLDDRTQDVRYRQKHQGLFTASSYHSGGVNVGAMDGSVRFIRDQVDIMVWRAVGTRASGDFIGDLAW
jgi:prepilin-type N-terminal cleavage/methylation domain-containing protein/prepilin-type processing-associated H-X9-DG protein